MTVTDLYATSHITGTVSTPANALGAPDAVGWTTDIDNTSWDSRFAMGNPTPGDVLSGTQTVTVRVRKETGTGTPTLTAEVWENGSFVATLFTNQSVTSLTGENIAGTFSGASITDAANVEVRLIGTASGGGPSARSTPQIDGITWTATHIAPSANLVVANAAMATAAEAPALTQVHELVVANALVSEVADSMALEQIHELAIAMADLAMSAEVPTIVIVTQLTVDDAGVATVAESLTLSQVHVLGVADGSIGVVGESPVLSQVHILAVADATIAIVAPNVTLEVPTVLAIADAVIPLGSPDIVVTQVHELSIEPATLPLMGQMILDLTGIAVDLVIVIGQPELFETSFGGGELRWAIEEGRPAEALAVDEGVTRPLFDNPVIDRS